MGRYYGVKNFTKRHNVSSYWKNCVPPIEEIEQMTTMFGWNLKDDEIYTFSYSDGYKLVEEDNIYKFVDMSKVRKNNTINDEEIADQENVKNIENNEELDTEPNTDTDDESYEWYDLGYDPDICNDDIKANIEKCKDKYNGVFFCN